MRTRRRWELGSSRRPFFHYRLYLLYLNPQSTQLLLLSITLRFDLAFQIRYNCQLDPIDPHSYCRPPHNIFLATLIQTYLNGTPIIAPTLLEHDFSNNLNQNVPHLVIVCPSVAESYATDSYEVRTLTFIVATLLINDTSFGENSGWGFRVLQPNLIHQGLLHI